MSIFRQIPEGLPLSPSLSPYDRFPYDLVSPTDACARGLQKIMAPLPLTSEFVGMVSYAPTCFLDIMDDDVGSDGSNIGDVAPSHRPSRECAMTDARNSGQGQRSPHGLTPLRALIRRPPSSHESTGRIYDDSGRISHRSC